MLLPPPLPLPLPKPARAAYDGDVSQGFVQVLLDVPDDTHARVLLAAGGVKFQKSGSLIPTEGVLSVHVSPQTKKARYCWRG